MMGEPQWSKIWRQSEYMVPGQLSMPMEKQKLAWNHITDKNFKWTVALNIESVSIKLLGDNIGKYFKIIKLLSMS